MSETVIPMNGAMGRKQNHVKFVGSRQGGPSEHKKTLQATTGKKQNPEYFQKLSDRKKADRYGVSK